MSRIKVNGQLKPAAVKMFVDDFLATDTEVDNIRDIWYKIKHKIEPWKPKKKTDKAWSDDVNADIGDYLFKLYLSGDIGIYDRLNLLTKALKNTGYQYNSPVVMMCEKPTRAFNKVTDELLAGYYESTGQIPSYEIVKIAEYLVENNSDDNVHMIAMVDYDPAGDSIFSSAVERLEQVLYLLDPDITLHAHKVEYGATHVEFIGKYDSYTLNDEQAKKWADNQGVEINVIDDKGEHIERTIIGEIDPYMFEGLSLSRARSIAVQKKLLDSKEYKTARDEVVAIENRIKKSVHDMAHNFTPDLFWKIPMSNGMVKKMTTLYELES